MSKTISINDATFDTQDLTSFLQRGLEVLDAANEAKEDFKEVVAEAVEKTGLDKKIIAKWVKARWADKSKDVVKDGETFAVLNDAVDN